MCYLPITNIPIIYKEESLEVPNSPKAPTYRNPFIWYDGSVGRRLW